MTKTTILAAQFAACAALAACGGGGSSAPPPAPVPPPPAPQSFDYVAPAVGETDVFTRILTDSQGTRVALQIRQRVSSANADGTLMVSYDDPTGTDVVEDGLTFRTAPEVVHVAANGGTLGYTVTETDGSEVDCSYGAPDSDGTISQAGRAQALGLRHADSLQVGQSFKSTYAITCGSQPPVTYHVNGRVIDVESVAVGTGVIQAVKETVTTSWVSNGFANNTDVTVWRDPARSLFPVMIDESITHGDTSKPWISHETRQLLSRQ